MQISLKGKIFFRFIQEYHVWRKWFFERNRLSLRSAYKRAAVSFEVQPRYVKYRRNHMWNGDRKWQQGYIAMKSCIAVAEMKSCFVRYNIFSFSPKYFFKHCMDHPAQVYSISKLIYLTLQNFILIYINELLSASFSNQLSCFLTPANKSNYHAKPIRLNNLK